jgi:hypothetical protein
LELKKAGLFAPLLGNKKRRGLETQRFCMAFGLWLKRPHSGMFLLYLISEHSQALWQFLIRG